MPRRRIQSLPNLIAACPRPGFYDPAGYGRQRSFLTGFGQHANPARKASEIGRKSDSVAVGKASTRSSARKPGYLTFPVVGPRVSVVQPAQPVWNFSPRFRSEFLPLGDARGSVWTAGVALGSCSRGSQSL